MSKVLEPVIGLEIHAQIATHSKLFCSCSADAWNALPNENVCPICMGFPGQLPVINKDAVQKAVAASLALGCNVPAFSKFDRKNYFYPDLVKGFQISQYDQPLSRDGSIEIQIEDQKKIIRINRLHVEDDAGKLTHIQNGTLCDYNRSGIGLMEIVTEPDIRSSREAGIFAREIQSILRYIGSCGADMEKGMMRFDASVSLREPGEKELHPRAEIKNLNSFRSLESAINYEIRRQTELWDKETPPDTNITVGWNEEKGQTYFLRNKEGADDYRYFPEPDLPPLLIDETTIQQTLSELPELPSQKRVRYENEFGLSSDDAVLLVSDKDFAIFFEKIISHTKESPKKVAAFLTSVVLYYMNRDLKPVSEFPVQPDQLAALLDLIAEGTISITVAKNDVFEEMYNTGKSASEIVKHRGFHQVSDVSAIEDVARKVLAENPHLVVDYKSGKEKVFGFLVGQVMKEMKGQANPQTTNEILKRLIRE